MLLAGAITDSPQGFSVDSGDKTSSFSWNSNLRRHEPGATCSYLVDHVEGDGEEKSQAGRAESLTEWWNLDHSEALSQPCMEPNLYLDFLGL